MSFSMGSVDCNFLNVNQLKKGQKALCTSGITMILAAIVPRIPASACPCNVNRGIQVGHVDESHRNLQS